MERRADPPAGRPATHPASGEARCAAYWCGMEQPPIRGEGREEGSTFFPLRGEEEGRGDRGVEASRQAGERGRAADRATGVGFQGGPAPGSEEAGYSRGVAPSVCARPARSLFRCPRAGAVPPGCRLRRTVGSPNSPSRSEYSRRRRTWLRCVLACATRLRADVRAGAGRIAIACRRTGVPTGDWPMKGRRTRLRTRLCAAGRCHTTSRTFVRTTERVVDGGLANLSTTRSAAYRSFHGRCRFNLIGPCGICSFLSFLHIIVNSALFFSLRLWQPGGCFFCVE